MFLLLSESGAAFFAIHASHPLLRGQSSNILLHTASFYTVNTPPTGSVNKPVIAHLDNLDLPKPFIRGTSSSFHYKIALVDSTDKDLAVVWRPWSVSSSREP